MAKTSYVVTAPYVTLTVPTTDGPQVRGFYAGATVPNGVSDESIKHHLDNGMIAKSADAEKELAAQPGELATSTGSTPAPGAEMTGGSTEPADGLGTLASVEQPKGNASEAEWKAYATASGMTAEELEGLSRDDVRALYTK